MYVELTINFRKKSPYKKITVSEYAVYFKLK